jgi:hypothetical protein
MEAVFIMNEEIYRELQFPFQPSKNTQEVYYVIDTELEAFVNWLDRYSKFSKVEHRNFWYKEEHFILCPTVGTIKNDFASAYIHIQMYEDECETEDGPLVVSFPVESVPPRVRGGIKYLDIPEIPEIRAWVNRLLSDIKQIWPGMELLNEVQSEISNGIVSDSALAALASSVEGNEPGQAGDIKGAYINTPDKVREFHKLRKDGIQQSEALKRVKHQFGKALDLRTYQDHCFQITGEAPMPAD